jgi:hypothetical protein
MAGALQINRVEHEEAHAFFACLRSDPWSELARCSPAASAADFPHATNRAAGVVVTVQSRQYARPQRDCTPTAGPFGFYGNIWCQPANEAS